MTGCTKRIRQEAMIVVSEGANIFNNWNLLMCNLYHQQFCNNNKNWFSRLITQRLNSALFSDKSIDWCAKILTFKTALLNSYIKIHTYKYRRRGSLRRTRSKVSSVRFSLFVPSSIYFVVDILSPKLILLCSPPPPAKN